MPKAKLTIRAVEDVQPCTKDVILWDSDIAGFGLKVTPKGKRTFFYFYRTADHTQRKPRIGDYPQLRPEQARSIARDWSAEVRSGGDPSARRKAQRATRGEGTIAQHFEVYKAFKIKERRKSVREIERVFRHDILPVLGRRKAEDITSLEVTKLIDEVAVRSPAVAWAVRRQLSAFYKWAIPRLPAGASNPVTNASRPPAPKARDRVLSDEELRELWAVLDNEKEPWRTALRLLILTGQRRDEVLSADWSEFDLAQRQWTIPGSRAKNAKAHVVPLSPQVVTLLKALPGREGRLFPRGTGLVSRAAKRIREAMKGVPEWRWHDIRRTVATGLQRLAVRLEVTEAILNHTSGSRAGIVGVYQRHDWAVEKRAALAAWANKVNRIVKPRRIRRQGSAAKVPVRAKQSVA